LGTPENTGHWFFYGESGHGKTTLLMQTVKELTKFEKVEYNTLEEGARLSMQLAVRENRMDQCRKGSFKLLHKAPIEEVKERLRAHKSAKIVVMDSVQYTFLTKKEFFELDLEFGQTHLFLWNSHARGKSPIGALAEAIMFHADQKVFVQGFKAFSKSRTSRGKLTDPYVIWEEGARDYHDIL
jgi:alpha-galactosidase